MDERMVFVQTWDYYMSLGFYGCLALAVLIIVGYETRMVLIKDYKTKYDYINSHEIKYFMAAVIVLVVGSFFYFNTIATDWVVHRGKLWIFIRTLITVGLGVIVYFIFNSMLRISYTKILERKLHKFRNKPRKSPEGNLMRKLSEEEEDAHLEASQIAEESSGVHAVDYDVWLDEKTGHKKVEKYFSYQHAEECPDCGYFTMKVLHEEVTVQPTQSEAGTLIKHYKCTYCNHRERKEVHLAKLADNV